MMVLVMVLLTATIFNGQAGPRKFETTVRSQSNGKYLTLPRREAARSDVRFTVRPRFFSPTLASRFARHCGISGEAELSIDNKITIRV